MPPTTASTTKPRWGHRAMLLRICFRPVKRQPTEHNVEMTTTAPDFLAAMTEVAARFAHHFPFGEILSAQRLDGRQSYVTH